jgi:anti-sigma factor RsiW
MRKFWGRQVPKLTCQELVELVTDYAEGDLPPEMQARFEEHLRACDGCTTYVEQMTRTLELTGSLTEESMSTDAPGHGSAGTQRRALRGQPGDTLTDRQDYRRWLLVGRKAHQERPN